MYPIYESRRFYHNGLAKRNRSICEVTQQKNND